MFVKRNVLSLTVRTAIAAVFVVGLSTAAWAQGPSTTPAPAPTPPPQLSPSTPSFEIYGFAQADAIADFKQINPQWYDALRPSRLPSFANEFGEDGRFALSARQSRFGARATFPTDKGPVKAQFEFDMFGVGADAGLTTIRLRHAYGEWKGLGAGQTNSQFMDIDIFPNIFDYWGPNGMLFFRNVQVYYRLKDDEKMRATVAIENPGASGDGGVYSDRIELQNIRPRFPMPDLTGNFRYKAKKAYVQVSGIVRKISYDDTLKDPFELGGSVTGAGISFSSNVNATTKDVLRLQYTYGKGIQNYFNDAPVDVAVKSNPGNAVTPIVGEPLPIHGLVLYLDHTWNSKYATAAGYSRVDIDNTDLEAASAYKSGQYVVISLVCTPVQNVTAGGEFQWAHRDNHSDGFKVDDYRLQFTFKYSFSHKLGG
jgi:hypothetical protein